MSENTKSHNQVLLESLTPAFIAEQLAQIFPDGFEGQSIQGYTVIEFQRDLARVVKQFLAEYEEGREYLLTNTLNLGTDYGGSINVQSSLNSIKNFLESYPKGNPQQKAAYIQAAGSSLRALSMYQRVLGFWDKGTANIYSADEVKLDSLVSRMELLQEQLNSAIQQNKTLNDNLEVEKNKLEEFRKQKEQELAQITQNLNTANQERNQISQALVASTESKTQIDNLKSNAEATKQSIETLKTSEEKALEDFKKKLEDRMQAITEPSEKVVKDLTSHRAEIEGYLNELKERDVPEKIAQLDELLGKEAASQLFRTFNARKNELNRPVLVWQITSIVIALGVIFLGLAVFTNFFGRVEVPSVEGQNGWQALMISSLKMVPAIILLYFVIRQYAKERAFQEEYAFRSAVALTVKSYADLIAGQKGEEIKNQLIADAVRDVYRSPKPMNWESGSIFSLRARGLNDSIKAMTEMLKEVKDVINKR